MASHQYEPNASTTVNALLLQMLQQTSYGDYAVLLLLLAASTGYFTNGKIWNKPDPYNYIFFERPQEAMSNESRSKETRNVAQKLDEVKKDLVIFWGSQSGTAEGFAHRLAQECHRRFKLDALVADLSDYDSTSIASIPNSKLAIFLMSTYGEGDPSDNASELWEWLKTNSVTLANLRYAAFGLGNSNYKYYNKVVDVLVEKLDGRNATSLYPVGKADDANSGTEEDFLEWKEGLFGMFRSKLGLLEHDQEYEPSLQAVEDTSLDIIDLHLGEPISHSTSRKAASQTSAIGSLPVRLVRELTNGPTIDRNCLHLELDLSDHAQIKYKTGDHLSIYPVNPAEEVTRLLRVLNLESRRDVPLLISSLDPSNKRIHIPSPTTLSALFTSYLEVCAPVSRETAQKLIPFASTEHIKSLLRTLSADKSAYHTFLQSNHVTLCRLLEYTLHQDSSEDATWSHLPLSFILESLTPMTPRHYSISSSSTTSPKQVSITVAVSPTPLPSNPATSIPGLATNYLSTISQPLLLTTSSPSTVSQSQPQSQFQTLTPQTTIYASIRRSTFKLPLSHTVPLILIGAGTGIAPLRAFLHERAAISRMGRPTGRILFFYGCRNPTQDYLYREEIESLLEKDVGPLRDLLTVVTAFSRPTENEETRKYVQDQISNPIYSKSITEIVLDNDGAVFFCGSTKMAKAAGDALLHVIQNCHHGDSSSKSEEGNNVKTDEEMLHWRDERRRMGRWKEDVWG